MSEKKRETSAKFKGSSLFQNGIQMKYRKEKKKNKLVKQLQSILSQAFHP